MYARREIIHTLTTNSNISYKIENLPNREGWARLVCRFMLLNIAIWLVESSSQYVDRCTRPMVTTDSNKDLLCAISAGRLYWPLEAFQSFGKYVQREKQNTGLLCHWKCITFLKTKITVAGLGFIPWTALKDLIVRHYIPLRRCLVFHPEHGSVCCFSKVVTFERNRKWASVT